MALNSISAIVRGICPTNILMASESGSRDGVGSCDGCCKAAPSPTQSPPPPPPPLQSTPSFGGVGVELDDLLTNTIGGVLDGPFGGVVTAADAAVVVDEHDDDIDEDDAIVSPTPVLVCICCC